MQVSELKRCVILLSTGQWQAAAAFLDSEENALAGGAVSTLLLLDLFVRCGEIDKASEKLALGLDIAPGADFIKKQKERIDTFTRRRSLRPLHARAHDVTQIPDRELVEIAEQASHLAHWTTAVELWSRAIEKFGAADDLVNKKCRALAALGRHSDVVDVAATHTMTGSSSKLSDLVAQSSRYHARRNDQTGQHVRRVLAHDAFTLAATLETGDGNQADVEPNSLVADVRRWRLALETLVANDRRKGTASQVRVKQTAPVASQAPLSGRSKGLPALTTAQDFFVVASQRIKERRYLDGLQLLEEGLKVDPGHLDSLLLYGKSLRLSGRAADALEVFVRARNVSPTHLDARVEHGKTLMAVDRNEEGLAALNDAIKHHPFKHVAHLELARALEITERLDEAQSSFLNASRIEPYRLEAQIERARLLVRLSRWAESLPCFETAIKIAPKATPMVVEYAGALSELRRYADAEKAFRTASLSAEDSDDRVEFALKSARMCRADGRAQDAISAITAICRDHAGNTEALRELVDALAVAGELPRAIPILELAAKSAPKSPEMLHVLGEMFIRLGQSEEALAAFSKASGLKRTTHGPEFLAGKAAYRLEAFNMAARYFEMATEKHADRPGYFVDFGRALLRQRRSESALIAFQKATELAPSNHDAFHGVGATLRVLGRPNEAITALRKALEINPTRIQSLLELGHVYEGLGRRTQASAAFEQALKFAPNNVRALISSARIAFEDGDVANAIAFCEKALTINPDQRDAELYLRWMKTSSQSVTAENISLCILDAVPLDQIAAVAAQLGDAVSEIVVATSTSTSTSTSQLPGNVKLVSGDWRNCIDAAVSPLILTCPGGHGDVIAIAEMRRRFGPRIGAVADALGPAAESAVLWRRDVLKSALTKIASTTWRDFTDELYDICQVRFSSAAHADTLLPRRPVPKGREAWLVSSSGVKLFGGVEQFLRTMVPIYREAGLNPIIVGLLERDDGSPPEGEVDGVPFLNISRDIETVRRTAIARRPLIAHGTTGIGYELAASLDGLSTRIVYGSHFWRDMFHGSGSFENVDLNPRPRQEFRSLCLSVDQPYANSIYTRDSVREHFGASQPVVYSLPFDLPPDAPRPVPGESALLLNGRVDKGFGLALQLAVKRPNIPFQVVAAQVARERLEEQIAEAGVKNIEILPWSADTENLYRQARAVLVPSYAFVETFSRVVIEAQRFGVPVIGSNRGNVPILLQDSGTALPEAEDAWLAELDRLYSDDTYWYDRSARAVENSSRYRFADQHDRVGRLINGALARIAVGVGSGIGNMIQASPTIRRISEHFGCPVDVLLREDFPGCAALFEGAKWVGSVITSDASLARYDVVLLLDCYGTLVPHFNAEVVHVSRRRFNFDQMREIHEAEFNLMAAREFLGVPYEPADAGRYFIGAHQATRGARSRVAIHAGSKGGVWAAKHWPYFPALIERLQAEGYEVASVGTAGEYVANTTNLTGTSLEATIRNIAESAYFIGNDSGLMHVADGLAVPLTTIFAPSSVIKNGPLAPNACVIKINKDCSPCQFDMRKLVTCRCIAEIGIDEVWGKVRTDLELYRG